MEQLEQIKKLCSLWDYLQTTDKKIVLYGMGDGADKILDVCYSKKIKIYAKASVAAFVAFLIFLIAGVSSFLGSKYDAAIEDAKTMTYYNNITYGELIDEYVRDAEWTAFNSESDMAVVEVHGTSVDGDKVCIQFWGESGMGLSYRTLTLEYFEVDGVSMDPNWMMEYIYLSYCIYE